VAPAYQITPDTAGFSDVPQDRLINAFGCAEMAA
jgi:hypothetical protein